MLSGVKTSQEIYEVGRRVRTFSLGIAGSRPDKELEMFFPGAPSCQAMGPSFPGFCVSKKSQIHTLLRRRECSLCTGLASLK